jgi:DNA-binding transcriptional ArsR family regulator
MRLMSYKGSTMYPSEARRRLPVHFQALAHPIRLAILEHLAEAGEVRVNDLAGRLRLSQPRVSWHLAMLRRGGVIRQRKEGRQVFCSLDLEAIRSHQRVFWALLDEKRRLGVSV